MTDITAHMPDAQLEQEDAMAYGCTLIAQYLTVLPDKQWFIDKLNRSIQIARELQANNG